MKILIADDDKTVLKVLERLLTQWGHTVLHAIDGLQAQSQLQAQHDIDMVILDWNMPQCTGIEILREYASKEDTEKRFFYSIIVTGNSETQHVIEGFDSGADDFITKPINVDELRSRVRAGERIVESQKKLIQRNALLDEEIKARTVELSEALKVAERASEMKSHFLANMSHEIRTPLNGIISYIELLLYSELTEEQEHDLKTIKSCAHSLRTIINDVLDFSKIEAGRMLIESAPFDLAAATDEVVELLKIVAQEKKLEIVSSFNAQSKKYVGDRIRYQQILSNILSNAIKFSHEGRAVSVLVQTGPYGDSGAGIELTISDTGIGIHPSKFESIFESFSQADTSTTRKYGGTGLGLTIVRKITELMGGRVWVNSVEGIGSTFHVTLPFASVAELESADREVPASDYSFQNLSVLVVEDNLTNQQAMKRILEKVGCVVTVANNGQEAVDSFQSSPTQCVLMDIQMPVMGGEEASQCLRRMMQAQGNRVPIIALTANVFEQDKDRYIASGIDEVLGKPVSYPDLFSTMTKLVERE